MSKPVTTTRGLRDPGADLLNFPVTHLLDCPAVADPALAVGVVEHYRSRRVTTRKAQHDVDDDQRPSVAIMVAHCVLCGGISYHDIVTQVASVVANGTGSAGAHGHGAA